MAYDATSLERKSLPSLWWAGAITVGLVWYLAASSMPGGLGRIDDLMVMHLSAGLFLVLSFLLTKLRSIPAKRITLVGQAVCAAAFIAVDQNQTGPILNIVLVAQLPYVMKIRQAAIAALVISSLQFFLVYTFHVDSIQNAFFSTALLACFQLFSLAIGHYAVQASEARNQLVATNAELMATRSLLESSARDRERLRVSRELHDTAGHTLTALKLNLRQLRDQSSGDQHAALEDCLHLSSGLLEDIRALVGNMREHDPLDLRQALCELTRPFAQPSFTINVASDVAINDLSVAENLLAVAREMITNVVRHANATQCVITVHRDEKEVRLTVTDDGVGTQGLREGFGIKGMRERLDRPGARLEIAENSPSGTSASAVWASA